MLYRTFLSVNRPSFLGKTKYHGSSFLNITMPRDKDYSWDYDMQSVDPENIIPPTKSYEIKEIKPPYYNKNINDIYQLQLINMTNINNNNTIAERNHRQLVKLLENNQDKISRINNILINNTKKNN